MAVFTEKNRRERSSAIFDEKNIQIEKKKRTKKEKVKSSFAEIAPVIDITANGYFQLSDGNGYFDIVQLTSKDIYSLNESDKLKDIYSLAYFYQWYTHDIKVLPLNFPVDTSIQQKNLMKKFNTAKNAAQRFFLQQKIDELKFIEKNRTNREYYMFIYAEDEYTLHSRINSAERLLSVVLPITRLDEDKKVNILYKLNNLNSKNKTKGEV